MKGYWLELTSEVLDQAYKDYATALNKTVEELEEGEKQIALLNHVLGHPEQSETDDWLGKINV